MICSTFFLFPYIYGLLVQMFTNPHRMSTTKRMICTTVILDFTKYSHDCVAYDGGPTIV